MKDKILQPMRNVLEKITQSRVGRWLHKIRMSLSAQTKMTLLTVVGFTVVFIGIGVVTVTQFQRIIYGDAERRVSQPFQPNQGVVNGVVSADIIDYTSSIKKKIALPKADVFYVKYYDDTWYMFRRHGDQVSYQNVEVEHRTVELVTNRMLLIFSLSEVALLAMAVALSRANMVPILRSWKQQKTFVADAAHEFKTPMTVIQNNLERMLEHPNDTVMDQVESVANSLTEVRHLNNLTGDLLTLAQADADVQLFAFAAVDVADIAREVHDIFSYNAEEREQKLQIDVPAHAVITGDAQRLRQLLVILTDNAQKYAGEGVIVTLRVVQNERQTLIAVSDTGQGVSDEDKRHLFDRFYRVDKARSRSTGGHGLGLAIAKWVTDGHHGTIVVEDTIPHGTTFKIILPNKQKGIK